MREVFADATAVLVFWRTLCDWETSRRFPPENKPSELDRWQLLLRL
jgi:hypothetical protein